MPSPDDEYKKIKANIEKLIIGFVDVGTKLTDESLDEFSMVLQKFNEALKQPNIEQEEYIRKIHLLDIPFARLKLHNKKLNNAKFAEIEKIFQEVTKWANQKAASTPKSIKKVALPHSGPKLPPLPPPIHPAPKKSDAHPEDHDKAETSAKKEESDPSSISDTFAKTAKLLQPGATGPTVRVETEDADSVGYYPYFKDKESQYKAGSKITIEIEIPNISPKEFAALQTALQETIDKNQSDTSFANETGASFHKVYAGASIIPSAGNKFTFCIDKKSAFDVNLEEAVGMSLTFATKSPNAQAIAAAAGMISDTVGAYNKKSGVRVKQLIIQDYENDLVAGLAIYCSLAGQDKPVCFGDKGAAFNAAGKQNDKRVFDLLQELYKTQEDRDQLLHLVDDGHKKLTDMIQYAKANPGCTDAELANAAGIKHVHARAATHLPTSSEPHEPGPLELRPKPPK